MGYLRPWLPQPCAQAKHCGSRVVFGRGSSLLDRNREKETKKSGQVRVTKDTPPVTYFLLSSLASYFLTISPECYQITDLPRIRRPGRLIVPVSTVTDVCFSSPIAISFSNVCVCAHTCVQVPMEATRV